MENETFEALYDSLVYAEAKTSVLASGRIIKGETFEANSPTDSGEPYTARPCWVRIASGKYKNMFVMVNNAQGARARLIKE